MLTTKITDDLSKVDQIISINGIYEIQGVIKDNLIFRDLIWSLEIDVQTDMLKSVLLQKVLFVFIR